MLHSETCRERDESIFEQGMMDNVELIGPLRHVGREHPGLPMLMVEFRQTANQIMSRFKCREKKGGNTPTKIRTRGMI